MPAKPLAMPLDISLSEVEAALELSSMDPDAPHTPRLTNILKAAVNGVTIGLENGGPVRTASGDVFTVTSLQPESMIEAGSVSHADFIH